VARVVEEEGLDLVATVFTELLLNSVRVSAIDKLSDITETTRFFHNSYLNSSTRGERSLKAYEDDQEDLIRISGNEKEERSKSRQRS
jgi:hypothetical protein